MLLAALRSRIEKTMRTVREDSNDPFEARYYEALDSLRDDIRQVNRRAREMEEARKAYAATRRGFRYAHSRTACAEIRRLCAQINQRYRGSTHDEARRWYLYLVEKYFRGDAVDRWDVIKPIYWLAEKLGRKDSAGPWDAPFITEAVMHDMMQMISYERPVPITETLREAIQALDDYASQAA